MKPGNFSFEEILHDIKYRINPDLKINDIELDNTGKRIKIYNLQGLLYITIQGLEEMITFYKNIPANEIVREFVKEMVNIYKAEETSNDNEIINLELCRIDHLTDHLFNLICKKYNDVSKVEDESIFGRIDISHCKVNLNNECPFEQPWVPGDINSIMNNVYSANDFLDMPKPCEEDLNKKYMGRGRSRIKQINIKDRPFICEYPECKRAFKRFEHLKRHNKMHTGERPYKCKYPGCMKSFSRSDNLAQHFKIHNVSSKPQSLTFRNYYETNKHLE